MRRRKAFSQEFKLGGEYGTPLTFADLALLELHDCKSGVSVIH
jgi:hypothetical protein